MDKYGDLKQAIWNELKQVTEHHLWLLGNCSNSAMVRRAQLKIADLCGQLDAIERNERAA